MQKKAQMLQAK